MADVWPDAWNPSVTTEPWLSVVMPTYNGGAYVAQALAGVAEQNDPDIEMIVVDDGSTDATVAIVNRFTDRLRLRLVVRPRTGNWVANTNYGVSLASGKWVSILHQDDVWLPGRAARVRCLVRQWPTSHLVIHACWFIDPMGRRVGRWRCPWPKRTGPVNAKQAMRSLIVQNFVAIVGPTIARSAIDRIGPMDETLWYTADWDYWLRLVKLGGTIYCPELLAGFRIHPQSQTVRRSAHPDDFRSQMETVVNRHLPLSAAQHGADRHTRRRARFSIDVNTALAAYAHGQKVRLRPLLLSAVRLGAGGLWYYLRDSRILERASSRFRVGWACTDTGSTGPAAFAPQVEDSDEK